MEPSHILTIQLASALAGLEENSVESVLEKCIENDIPPLTIIDGLSKGMEEVGNLYRQGEYYLSELVYSGDIFNKAMGRVKPLIPKGAAGVRSSGMVVMGTVKNDVHDLGKNIVVTMLECSGFTVHDVGVDAEPEKFVEALKRSGARLVGMSVLLTTAFGSLQSTIDAVKEAGLGERVKTVIGGAVVNEDIRKKMGADYFGADAIQAVDIARKVYSEVSEK
ncbi:MAG: cobalamin B12-binding domain-containing protein [Deltaproteobacteria bacterium]|nr:cobalamin B12-binding domain-containing protein [Deltaproteobacteria bacterium]